MKVTCDLEHGDENEEISCGFQSTKKIAKNDDDY
jgi:hypothetical protein